MAAADVNHIISDAQLRSIEGGADAELLRLGKEYNGAWAEYQAAKEAAERAGELANAEARRVARRAGLPDDQDKWRNGHGEIWVCALGRAESKFPNWVEALDKEEAAMNRVAEICEKIWHERAHTIAGLGVKAVAAAHENQNLLKSEFKRLDWSEQFIADLLKSCLAASGKGDGIIP